MTRSSLFGLIVGLVLSASCGAETTVILEPQCSADRDCPFGEACADGECVAGCLNDGDCGPRGVCLGGACASGGGFCNSDRDCDFGQLCSNDACVDHLKGRELCEACELIFCDADEDCPDGVSCDHEREQCQVCGEGGLCRFEGGQACEVDDECPIDQTCDPVRCFEDRTCISRGLGTCEISGDEGTCSMGRCEGSRCSSLGCSAAGDDRCPRGYDCFSIVETDIPCLSDADCPTGRPCYQLNEASPDRYCGCTTDATCPGGAACLDFTDRSFCELYSECLPALGAECRDLR